jgi:signal transduction histidine kinase
VRKIIGIEREVRGRRKDSTVFPMELGVSEIRTPSKRYFTGILRDISSRRALEKEVAEASDKEQRRIGQDLHDTVGQKLTGLAFLAEDLAEDLSPRAPEQAKLAVRITATLREILGDVRTMSRGLIPVEVGPEGLMAALADLAARVSEPSRVTCTFHCEEPVLVSDPITANHLFRIAQEAITNALTHGKASHIGMSLAATERGLTLTIRDDGVGIGNPPTRALGMGLKIMQHRAALIGAALRVEPAEGGGTVVNCTTIPVGGGVTNVRKPG